MNQEIKAFICDYFLQKGKFQGLPESEFAIINFVEARTLDSIEFIMMISEIEENFNITFSEEDIQSPSFSTIDGVSQIASKRLTQ